MVAVVELRDLALEFRRDGNSVPVFRDLSLALERGTFTSVVGASGVGKSTLLRVIAGLIPASGGDVRVIAEKAPDRRPLALVFQEARLMPWRDVIANVELGLEGLDVERDARRARASDALRLVGLSQFERRRPSELSGGQRQRVGIARALAVEPDLLLLDEPFAALDAITRHGLQEELLRIWQETRKTVIFVTHDIDEAVYLSDRVVLLRGDPATIGDDRAIDTPRHDRRTRPEFGETVERIRAGLSGGFEGGAGI